MSVETGEKSEPMHPIRRRSLLKLLSDQKRPLRERLDRLFLATIAGKVTNPEIVYDLERAANGRLTLVRTKVGGLALGYLSPGMPWLIRSDDSVRTPALYANFAHVKGLGCERPAGPPVDDDKGYDRIIAPDVYTPESMVAAVDLGQEKWGVEDFGRLLLDNGPKNIAVGLPQIHGVIDAMPLKDERRRALGMSLSMAMLTLGAERPDLAKMQLEP